MQLPPAIEFLLEAERRIGGTGGRQPDPRYRGNRRGQPGKDMAPEALLGHGAVEVDHPDRRMCGEERREIIGYYRVRVYIRIQAARPRTGLEDVPDRETLLYQLGAASTAF